MSMQKLRGIRNTGEYTAQRSMVEHLLLLEEIILREMPNINEIPNEKERITQQLKEYKEQHHINKSFDIENIQHYLLATAEREMPWRKSVSRGLYTSALIQQAEGDEPITIDMQGNKIDSLLYAINTPRHITINNTKGNHTGAYAGSHHGTAHLTINNTKGNWTGAYAGKYQGTANLTIHNTKGDRTGAYAGSKKGTAHLIIINNQGNYTGECSGIDGGKTITVAYNCQGASQFFNHRGIFILNNPDKSPRMKRVDNKQKKQVLHLIAKKTPPEEIMNYLRRHT